MANTHTVTLHRVFKTDPAKLFRAFTMPGAYAAWLPPYGFFAEIDHLDARTGGTYKMSFTNFTTGNKQSFGGEFIKVEQDKFIQFKDRFDDPNLPGEMNTTIEFNKVSVGTEIKIVQAGIPEQIPVEACYLGWQDSLEKLKSLVEPVIPDA